MSFQTDTQEVLDAFDKWKEKEIERLDDQIDFNKLVMASIPGPGRVMDKIITKAVDKLKKTIGSL